MNVSDCYKIGFILKPHGLKGEVTISIDAEAPEEIEEIETVFVQTQNNLVPFFIEEISQKGEKAFVKFEDVNTIESAQQISKCAIFLPKSSRPKSGRGDFYDDEIIGFEVIDKEKGSLGSVEEVTSAGPNKLISIVKDDKEVLIPINGPFITSINKSKRKISVDLPEGFLDI